MKLRSRLVDPIFLLLAMIFSYSISFNVHATCRALIANKFFDGVNEPVANMAVLVEDDKVKQVGPSEQLLGLCGNKINLGDATILPGFIESHSHITFQNVRKDKVLEHGITTAQDTGGPLLPPQGGLGSLRLLSTGPIIQAEGGYPLNIFTHPSPGGAYDQIGYMISPTSTKTQVEDVVQHLVDGGATAIKISLENGNKTTEIGAPWLQPHGADPVPEGPWPMLSLKKVQWIVAKAHALDRRVIAHVGEQKGFDRALAGGVDELAHMPCAAISLESLNEAAHSDVTIVTTIDTLGSCAGVHQNAHNLAHIMEHHGGGGSKFSYGSEIGHDNVPWGINGEEMHLMMHLTGMSVVDIFRSATSKAGERLGIPGLGTLTPGAPADIIAVKGNPFEKFKLLEYPDLVMSGGRIVVNKFKATVTSN